MNSYHDGDVYPVDVSQSTSSTNNNSSSSRTLIQTSRPSSSDMSALLGVLSNSNVYISDILYRSQYDPTSLQYMLEFFRHVAQTIPQPAEEDAPHELQQQQTMPIEPMQGNARDMLQDRAGIIVLREDLDFYAIPPFKGIEQTEMIEVKRAAGKALLRQNGIFSGLRKSEEVGTTEQHLIEMLTAG